MNRLKEFREKIGISQTQLSYRAHIPSTVISSIECGRLYPYPKAKRALARVLKCKQAELFPEDSFGK
jgi:ribosome-binding protein aMBF1 (putative translation factor)